jgi:CRISPR-associated endonuclease/helicase Cas3
MADLTAEQFDDFFLELWGKDRFDWQHNLAKRVLEMNEKPWPEVIALPTAAGKTACIDIAVFALAAQADRLQDNCSILAPRRIFFVVDRRIIVDEAFDRAKSLADKLTSAQSGILREVADRLRMLARGENAGYETETPLRCFELRGGMYRSEAWAHSPLQPLVVASTVDQLGSRLLFRGYGRGSGMWPILAGLAGNDSLIFLDEAHCSQPFMETLKAVERYRGWAQAPLCSAFHLVIMSATPPAGLNDVFYDTSKQKEDREHPLGKRQQANKPARLEIAKNAKGKNAVIKMAKKLIDEATGLAGDKGMAVVVFANRVATAREAYRLLAAKHGDRAILLTGRMRPIDKDDTVNERLKDLSADCSADRQFENPTFVVATQTLEVGANLDFDMLVTECASLDALRQRFGRLNRMGRPIEAEAVIVVRADQTDPEKSDDDPVYGKALANTWKWLIDEAGEEKVLDFGIAHLEKRFSKDETERQALFSRLNAPPVSAPVMLPAHVDCWAQTAPEPVPTPDVAFFLHGPQRNAADVQVCWRADLDLSSEIGKAASLDVLSQVPPAAAECLPVPIGVFRRWLVGEGSQDSSADIEGSDVDVEAVNKIESVNVVRWRGRDTSTVTSEPKDIRPGDVVVISAVEKNWEFLGDLARRGNGLPVFDWGDRAHAQARARAVFRLHPAVINQWPESGSRSRMLDLLKESETRYDEDSDNLLDDLRKVLLDFSSEELSGGYQKLADIARHLSNPKNRARLSLHPIAGLIMSSKNRLPTESEDNDSFTDEDDAGASGTVHKDLSGHLNGVAMYAYRFAKGSGLDDRLIDALKLSGSIHDLGKADPRFQAWLRGGSPWMHGELLAKSEEMPQGQRANDLARRRAGYPQGGRHELLSIRLVKSMNESLLLDEELRALVLHLVESHHGHCRPFAPVVFDENPIPVSLPFNGLKLTASSATKLEQLDSGVSERFWRLVRRYGWWGLAYLEAILRLADHRRSEWEAVQKESENE